MPVFMRCSSNGADMVFTKWVVNLSIEYVFDVLWHRNSIRSGFIALHFFLPVGKWKMDWWSDRLLSLYTVLCMVMASGKTLQNQVLLTIS